MEHVGAAGCLDLEMVLLFPECRMRVEVDRHAP
jgi:hypothetical protein